MRRSRLSLIFFSLVLAAGCAGAGNGGETAAEGAAAEGTAGAVAEVGGGSGGGTADGWTRIRPGGETTCALDTEFSFFARRAAGDRLLVYFQGGGACWNARTCDPEGDPTYSLDVDERDNPANRPLGIFDLDNPENPVREHSMVMVPYCTGDVHLGDEIRTYTVNEDGSTDEFTIRHRGYVNAMAALDWLEASWPSPSEIVVAGSSAGSIPSPFYAGILADRHRDARVTALGDASGSYRRDPESDSDPTASWGTLSVLQRHPGYEGLEAGELGFEDLYIAAGTRHPELRLLQFDSARDAVQGFFLDLAYEERSSLPELIAANREEIRASVPGFRGYLAGGPEHTILWRPALYSYEVDGYRFRDWLAGAIAGEPLEDIECEDCDRPEIHLTGEDVRILERARELLALEGDWSPETPARCPRDFDGPLSLRCALVAATTEVLGAPNADAAAVLEARFQARDRLAQPLEERDDPLRAFNERTGHAEVVALLETVIEVARAHSHD